MDIASLRETTEVFRLLVFMGILGGGVYYDLKEGRIPNALSLWALLSGLLLATLSQGFHGLAWAALGFLAGGGPLMITYLMGVAIRKPLMGAGDVKLMAGVGAFAGPMGALLSLLYALFLSGGVALLIILVQVLRRKPIPKTLPFGALLAFGAIAAIILRPPVFSPFLASLVP